MPSKNMAIQDKRWSQNYLILRLALHISCAAALSLSCTNEDRALASVCDGAMYYSASDMTVSQDANSCPQTVLSVTLSGLVHPCLSNLSIALISTTGGSVTLIERVRDPSACIRLEGDYTFEDRGPWGGGPGSSRMTLSALAQAYEPSSMLPSTKASCAHGSLENTFANSVGETWKLLMLEGQGEEQVNDSAVRLCGWSLVLGPGGLPSDTSVAQFQSYTPGIHMHTAWAWPGGAIYGRSTERWTVVIPHDARTPTCSLSSLVLQNALHPSLASLSFTLLHKGTPQGESGTATVRFTFAQSEHSKGKSLEGWYMLTGAGLKSVDSNTTSVVPSGLYAPLTATGVNALQVFQSRSAAGEWEVTVTDTGGANGGERGRIGCFQLQFGTAAYTFFTCLDAVQGSGIPAPSPDKPGMRPSGSPITTPTMPAPLPGPSGLPSPGAPSPSPFPSPSGIEERIERFITNIAAAEEAMQAAGGAGDSMRIASAVDALGSVLTDAVVTSALGPDKGSVHYTQHTALLLAVHRARCRGENVLMTAAGAVRVSPPGTIAKDAFVSAATVALRSLSDSFSLENALTGPGLPCDDEGGALLRTLSAILSLTTRPASGGEATGSNPHPTLPSLPSIVPRTSLDTLANVHQHWLSTTSEDLPDMPGDEEAQARAAREETLSLLTAAILYMAGAGDEAITIAGAPWGIRVQGDELATGCYMVLTVARIGAGTNASVQAAPMSCARGGILAGAVVPSRATLNLPGDANTTVDIRIFQYSRPLAGIGWEAIATSGSSSGALLGSDSLDTPVVSITLQTHTGDLIPVSGLPTTSPVLITLPCSRNKSTIDSWTERVHAQDTSMAMTCPSADEARTLHPGSTSLAGFLVTSVRLVMYSAIQPPAWRPQIDPRMGTTWLASRAGMHPPSGTANASYAFGERSISREGTEVTLTAACADRGRSRLLRNVTVTCGPQHEGITLNLPCPASAVAPLCAFWNETELAWSAEGCTLYSVNYNRSNADSITCACVHLTDFAARFAELAADNNAIFRTAVLFQDPAVLAWYPHVFIVLAIQLALLVLACVWADVGDAVGNKRFRQQLLEDEEMQFLASLAKAEGRPFILDRVLDRPRSSRAQSNKTAPTDGLSTMSTRSGSMQILSVREILLRLGVSQDQEDHGSHAPSTNEAVAIHIPAPLHSSAASAQIVTSGFNAVRPLSVPLSGHAGLAKQGSVLRMAAVARVAAAYDRGHMSQHTAAATLQRLLERSDKELAAPLPCRHGEINDAKSAPLVEQEEQNGSEKASNLPALVMQLWVLRMWLSHTYLSAITKFDPRVSRRSRVLTLYAVLLANLTMTALLFALREDGSGVEPATPSEVFVLALICAAAQQPIDMIITALMARAGASEFRWRRPSLWSELARRSVAQCAYAHMSAEQLAHELRRAGKGLPADIRGTGLEQLLGAPASVSAVPAAATVPEKESESLSKVTNPIDATASESDSPPGWIDPPSACLSICWPLVWGVGRLPRDKAAYISWQREREMERTKRADDALSGTPVEDDSKRDTCSKLKKNKDKGISDDSDADPEPDLSRALEDVLDAAQASGGAVSVAANLLVVLVNWGAECTRRTLCCQRMRKGKPSSSASAMLQAKIKRSDDAISAEAEGVRARSGQRMRLPSLSAVRRCTVRTGCACTRSTFTAYALVLTVCTFCVVYLMLFGLYQPAGVTQAFLVSWITSQAISILVIQPAIMLLVLGCAYTIWPAMLPYFVWIPCCGRACAGREAHALGDDGGSSMALTGRMENITLLRAAGYASGLPPDTAVLAYGAVGAVAAAITGVRLLTSHHTSSEGAAKGWVALGGEAKRRLILDLYLVDRLQAVLEARKLTQPQPIPEQSQQMPSEPLTESLTEPDLAAQDVDRTTPDLPGITAQSRWAVIHGTLTQPQ